MIDFTSTKDGSKNILNYLRMDNRNKLVLGHLNINLVCSKLGLLSEQVKENIDILMSSETKVDDSFPIENFLIDGFSTPYCSDCDSNGGGIMLFLKDTPSHLLAIN